MNSNETINELAKQKGWRLIQCIDLGTNADVFVLEDGSKKYALKAPRFAFSTARLEVEYLVLRYLAQTPMKQYVPSVYEWLPEVDGFLIEYLSYPDQRSKNSLDATQIMALMLKTLHEIDLPAVAGIGDDRPDILAAISERFDDLFDKVLEKHSFWATLPKEAVPKLEIVRRHHQTYRDLLAEFRRTAQDMDAALTHGDLAGDNIMMTVDGRLVLTDWGEARISTALADLAYLFTYSAWPPEEISRFVQLYFGDQTAKIEKKLLTIRVLSKLYQYHSCVQSLLWMKASGDNGLDRIGREHFERQSETL